MSGQTERDISHTFSVVVFNGIKPTLSEGSKILTGCCIIGDVRVGDKASIFPGCVLRGDLAPIVIGPGTNIQDGVIVHVAQGLPCSVGSNVTVGHRALLHACTVEDNCLIGMGSIVLDGAVIGEGSIIGAGAVVGPGVHIPPNSLAVGIPARVKRELTAGEKDMLDVSAAGYQTLSSILAQSPVESVCAEPPAASGEGVSGSMGTLFQSAQPERSQD